MRMLLYSWLCWMAFGSVEAQSPVSVFKDTRVINTHSTEVLPAHKLDVRISHRFGDFAGAQGGFRRLFGLESASDVMIGLDYGLTDRLTAGLHRSKGTGRMPDGSAGLRQLFNGMLKFSIFQQTSQMPVSLTLLGVGTFSGAEKIADSPNPLDRFERFAHRMAYHSQLMLARRFSDRISVQFAPGYTHRNFVQHGDENGLFSLSGAAQIQITKVYGLILDGNFPLAASRNPDQGFRPAVGVGLEVDTGGHVFQLNFTNATGMAETDFIPYTTARWGKGEFRMGFTIRRLFNL